MVGKVNKQQIQHGIMKGLTDFIHDIEFPIKFTSIPTVVCNIQFATNINSWGASNSIAITELSTTGFKFIITTKQLVQILPSDHSVHWIAITD